jgi:ADP-heptose:LPS heptosyltransferase
MMSAERWTDLIMQLYDSGERVRVFGHASEEKF